MKTNYKSSTMLQKIIASLLCICMLFSLMPVTPASAVAAPVSGTEISIDLPEGFSGVVYRYETYNTGSLTLGKVTASVYGVEENILSYHFRLKYDTDKVKVVTSTGGTPSDFDPAFVASKLTSDVVTTGAVGQLFSIVFNQAEMAYKEDTGKIIANFTMIKDSMFQYFLQQDGKGIGTDSTKIVDVFEMYFASADGSSITDETYDFLSPDTDDSSYPNGVALWASSETSSSGQRLELSAPHFEGFPEEKEPTYELPIKVYQPGSAQKGMYNVTVTFTSTSDSTKTYSATTNADGDAEITLPAGYYNITAVYNDTWENLKDYEVSNYQVVPPTSGTTLDTYTIQMTEGDPDTYGVSFKVVDGDNGNAPISGATVNLGDTKKTTSDLGIASYSELQATSYTINVTAAGYEDFLPTDGSITINAAGASMGSEYDDIFDYDPETKTATLTMSSKKTQITIPVPVPTDGSGKALDASKAGDLKVVISANPDGTTPATLDLPITVTTTTNDGTGNILNVTPASGEITDIDAVVNLPKGNYIVTISGAGIDGTSTTLNVVPQGTNNTVVNLGGDVAGDGTVTNGYTDSITNASGTIDLGEVKNEATTGSTINPTTGEVTGGANATGGVLNNLEASYGTDADVTIITDPIYIVKGDWEDSSKSQMKVKVYLKNVSAITGTFGLKYDSNLFENVSFEFDADSNLTYAQDIKTLHGPGGKTETIDNPDTGSDYHAFVWQFVTGNEQSAQFDTTGGEKLIGTYTLNVKTNVGDIDSKMHNEAIYIMPYIDTTAGKKIEAFYDSLDDTGETGDLFISEYWRESTYVGDEYGNLDSSLDLEDGFFQVSVVTDTTTWDTNHRDVRTQFFFEDNGNVAVTIKVQDSASNPVEGAYVHIYPEGTDTLPNDEALVKTVTTNSNGDAIFAWPENKQLEFQITTKDTYLPYPTSGDVTAKPCETDPIGTEAVTYGPYTLIVQEGHQVKLDTEDKDANEKSTADKVNLLGEPLAYNMLDYYFSLELKPGYTWVSGLPGPNDITVTLKDDPDAVDDLEGDKTLQVHWSSTENRYYLLGADIEGKASEGNLHAGDIIISVKDSVISETPNSAYKITANIGENGELKVADDTTTYTGTYTTTLGSGVTEHGPYVFTPATGYLVDQVLINGVEMSLTDAQRKKYEHTFTGISSNQDITVTFGEDNDGDGEIDDPAANEATLSVVVGDYGSTEITGVGDAGVTLSGPGSATYLLAGGSEVKIAVTAETGVPQPGGTTQSYVIDQVLVNGVQVNVSTDLTDVTWESTGEKVKGDDRTGTLTLSNLAADKTTTVVITFRTEKANENDDPIPMQAVVMTTVVSGKGTIVATGSSIHNVDDRPTFTITPEVNADEAWEVVSLDRIDPGTTNVVHEIDNVADNGATTDNTVDKIYTVPALKAGVTTLQVGFAEQTTVIKVKVDASAGGTVAPADTQVKLTFVRSGDNPDERPYAMTVTPVGEYAGIADFEVQIPQGTWTVTVKKDGFLDYIITDFVVSAGGKVDGTYFDGTYTYFGTKDEEGAIAAAKAIKLTIGDASHDGMLISLNDVAQVINGMVYNPDPNQVKRADFTENGDLSDDEIGFVKTYFGSWRTKVSYEAFRG